jgi:hypothetical protein
MNAEGTPSETATLEMRSAVAQPDTHPMRTLIAPLVGIWLAAGLPFAAPTAAAIELTKLRDPLTASDGKARDRFGMSVAVSGDTAVIGAPNEGAPPGTNLGRGVAYVFTRVGGGWIEQAKLIGSDVMVPDKFGFSVAISGDTIVVGANLATVSGKPAQGAAYVFTRTGATWTQQAKLTASDGLAGDDLGVSVAVSGDTALIGAELARAGMGAACVFTRTGGTWTEQAKLTDPKGAALDQFGRAVAITGDTAVVGAILADGLHPEQGAAYVFTRTGTTWTQQAKLTASDGHTDAAFGLSVSLSDESAMIVGATGDQQKGAAYVFTRAGGTWTEQAKLTASDGAANDNFGRSVALSGDTAVVGAHFKVSAYLFTHSGGTWTQQTKLIAEDGTNDDLFGNSVAMSVRTGFVGAGMATVGNASQQGKAYVFEASAPTVSPSPPRGRLQNISTRVRAETGDNIPIAGFIIAGSDAKRVLLRGLGPSLAQAGVADPLQDPTLELYNSAGTLVLANDNWKDAQQADIAATGLAPSDDRESAIVVTLSPSSHTAVLRGKNNSTGVSLVEVYDLNQSANSELANISTRGFVQTGNNVVIGGFIPVGGATRLVIRGLGPSLEKHAVANSLQDPTLELRNKDGDLILENDNWKDTQRAEIEATGLAPERDAESAIVTTLQPAPATAIVRGQAGTTGVGLVEIYKVQ